MTYSVKEVPTAPRVKYVCEECGGDDVTATFYCTWSIDKQDWVVGDDYGNDYCNDCEEEASLTQEKI